MVKVFTAQNSITVAFWKNYLEQQGITCQIRNEFLSSAAGEVPPIECWPELWIDDERDEQLALKSIASDPLRDRDDLPAWQCGRCGEESEGQFTDCWNCGKQRDV
ncbi:MAG: hypothetical protein A6F71_01310 [Cycloclasticus sp. symbiont of Poecilosclerida sp. M]|nr:MAG: hypothetical protein A6F71_01310 [Cycloclasticus sp. symbiont of Poecilosclerida sp. M]